MAKIPKQIHFVRVTAGQPPEFRKIYPRFRATHNQDNNKKSQFYAIKFASDFEKHYLYEKLKDMKILSVKQFSSRLKVTIQSSGRLNFTDDTTKTLGIAENTPIKFAIDDENDNTLYLVIASDSNDEDAFKVRKSGSYYYVPTKNLFDALGLEYEGKSLCYDLVRAESQDVELGGMAFKMSQREKGRGGGNDDTNE